MTYIPLEDCKDGVLYRINARNFSIGVFNKKTNGFIGIRTKFDSKYLFTEYHWDKGAPFGTVKPQEELPDKVPEGIGLYESEPTVCINCSIQVKFKPYVNGIVGEWYHLEETTCNEVRPTSYENEPLTKWLYDMKKKYAKI